MWVCGLVWVGGLVCVGGNAIRSRLVLYNAALAPLVTSSRRCDGVVMMRGRAKRAKTAFWAQTDSKYSIRPLRTTCALQKHAKGTRGRWA